MHHSYLVRVTECHYTDVPNAVWTRFLVHKGTIVLESFLYHNKYMDAHHDGKVHLTHAPNPPVSKDWAQWRLINVKGDNIVALESNRYRDHILMPIIMGFAALLKEAQAMFVLSAQDKG
jgi:hypothetical protein